MMVFVRSVAGARKPEIEIRVEVEVRFETSVYLNLATAVTRVLAIQKERGQLPSLRVVT